MTYWALIQARRPNKHSKFKPNINGRLWCGVSSLLTWPITVTHDNGSSTNEIKLKLSFSILPLVIAGGGQDYRINVFEGLMRGVTEVLTPLRDSLHLFAILAFFRRANHVEICYLRETDPGSLSVSFFPHPPSFKHLHTLFIRRFGKPNGQLLVICKTTEQRNETWVYSQRVWVSLKYIRLYLNSFMPRSSNADACWCNP